MNTEAYTDPWTVKSPKGVVSDLDVIYDGKAHGWSLARMNWEGSPVFGMRWNGGSHNGIPSVGNPQSRGKPTWFVLPEEIGEIIKSHLTLHNLISEKPENPGAES